MSIPKSYSTQVLAIGLCLFATVGLVSQADPWTSPSGTRDGLFPEAPSFTPALDDSPMTVQIARSTKMDATCPLPTLARGMQCVLEGDLTLTATLELASDTTLNCRGHKIVPVSVGSGSTRSQPEIGILLIAVQNSRLQNCVLDGFDFGVFAAGSKVSPEIRNNPGALARRRNSLVSNVINARFYGIQMFNVDNTEIKGNAITFKSPGGIGIEVTRDSDLNQIRNNAVVGSFSPPIDPAPMAPGPSNPPMFSGGGLVIFVAQLGSLSLIPALANVIVGDALYQFSVSVAERSEDNLVEENTIIQNVHSSVSPIQGIGTSQAIGTIVRRNKIVRASTRNHVERRRRHLDRIPRRVLPGFEQALPEGRRLQHSRHRLDEQGILHESRSPRSRLARRAIQSRGQSHSRDFYNGHQRRDRQQLSREWQFGQQRRRQRYRSRRRPSAGDQHDRAQRHRGRS